MAKKKTKIAVGMSGGVDSSVAAMLLKKAGYDVVGLFMKLWHDPTCKIERENACCDEKALLDAKNVARILDIPFYVVDARAKFKDEVTDYFIDEYKNLRTPNPCIVCNKTIKFGWLLDFAESIGCEKLATGHYARIVGSQQQEWQPPTADFKLLCGVDPTRDQSYFLYSLSQEQLSKILFPLGEMQKSEVRKIAEEAKLPVFEKAESREICFVDDDYRDFLKRNLNLKYFEPGLIVDKQGYTIGKHLGLINYTIGQRKNVNQELRIMNKGKDKEPLYVVGYNLAKNQLIVGEEKDLYRDNFEIEKVNWINQESRIKNQESRDHELGKIKVKIRYQAEPILCTIETLPDSKFLIHTSIPVRALASGQSAVFYRGEELMGGGIIV